MLDKINLAVIAAVAHMTGFAEDVADFFAPTPALATTRFGNQKLRAATMVEYMMMVAIAAVVVAGLWKVLGPAITGSVNKVGTCLGDASYGSGAGGCSS